MLRANTMGSEELKQIFNYGGGRDGHPDVTTSYKYCFLDSDFVSPSTPNRKQSVPTDWRFSGWQGAAVSVNLNLNANHTERHFALTTPRRRRGTNIRHKQTPRMNDDDGARSLHESDSDFSLQDHTPRMGDMPGVFSPEPLVDVSKLKNPYTPRSILAVYYDVNDEHKNACALRPEDTSGSSRAIPAQTTTQSSPNLKLAEADFDRTGENPHIENDVVHAADENKNAAVKAIIACAEPVKTHRGEGDHVAKRRANVKKLNNIVCNVQREVLLIFMLFFLDIVICFHSC